MPQQLWSIQYIRALAALMVLALHLWSRLCLSECSVLPASVTQPAAFGVELFFIISGIVIWKSTEGRDVYPNEFLIRRLLRVAPLYFVTTLFVAAVAWSAPSLLQNTKFDLEHLIYSLMFLPHEHPVTGKIWPVVIPGWSLNYEIFFLFCICLRPRLASPLAACSNCFHNCRSLGGRPRCGHLKKSTGGSTQIESSSILAWEC